MRPGQAGCAGKVDASTRKTVEMLFQLTSNYPPSNTGAALHVWRGQSPAGKVCAFRPRLFAAAPRRLIPAMMSRGKRLSLREAAARRPWCLRWA